MIFAMYLVVAEKQGVDWKTLSGTIQNDILKEFIAQKEYIFPPRPSMRLITDIFAFCAEQVPRWNTISVSGYHIREAGATALQELAFTLRDGIEYVQWGVDAGLDVDDFVPRISFFFNAHSDFFEEIAKYRAARKLWAHVMRDRFGARDERSLEAALPQPDRRRVADGAAAVQQRRPDGAAGAVGGARRHQFAPHQLAGRGARAADRRGGDARAAHAADHRPRERRRQRRRSARRVVFRREADEGPGRRRARILRGDRPDGRHGRGDRARLSAEGDRRERLSFPAGGRAPGEDYRRRQRVRGEGRAADRDPLHRRDGGRARSSRGSTV